MLQHGKNRTSGGARRPPPLHAAGEETFFCEEDYREYLSLMSQWCSRWNVEAYPEMSMVSPEILAGRRYMSARFGAKTQEDSSYSLNGAPAGHRAARDGKNLTGSQSYSNYSAIGSAAEGARREPCTASKLTSTCLRH